MHALLDASRPRDVGVVEPTTRPVGTDRRPPEAPPRRRRVSPVTRGGARIGLVIALLVAGLAGPSDVQAATVQATLVRSTPIAGPGSDWAHPSPDPSGITYNSRTGQLIISDGEVEESGESYPAHVYQGTNLFVVSLQGQLLETGANTLPYSAEPAGVAFRPASSDGVPERLFISDDDLDLVFEVSRGRDDRYGTADDVRTRFSARFTGSLLDDAEDVAVVLGPGEAGELLIVDGVTGQFYVHSWGRNGTFDGLPVDGGDDTVRRFDIPGARDPEGIVHNPYRNTIFVLDDPSNRIYELDMQGELQNVVGLPFLMGHGAGITLAPPSDGSGGPPNAYIVDRGVDNDADQDTFNDGRLHEVAIPGLTGPVSGTEAPALPPSSVGAPEVDLDPAAGTILDEAAAPQR